MNIEAIHRKKGTVYRAVVGRSHCRQTKCFNRKVDAQRWLVEVQSAMHSGQNGVSSPDSEYHPITFGELFSLFQKGYSEIYQEPGTRRREAQIVKDHLAPNLGTRDVNELTQRDIQQYLYQEARKGDRKPATINKHHQVLHKTFAWAVKNGLMAKNPASDVSKLPTRDTVYSPNYKFLEEKDVFEALKMAKEHYPREYLIFATTAMTGLRAGEVCALQRKDILDSAPSPVLLVRRTYCDTVRGFKESTKGGNARIVPISDALLGVLKPLVVKKRDNDLLFFQDLEEAIRVRHTLHKKWMRVQRLAGIQPRTFHALRHTYATLFLAKGGSPFALQRILGHSSAKITDKYSHFSRSLIESSRNILQIPA